MVFSVPFSNDNFTPEERSILRAAFLRLIPQSEEVARAAYVGLTEVPPEVAEEAIQKLAAVVDAMEESSQFSDACCAWAEWHRSVGMDAQAQRDLGVSFVQALHTSISPLTSFREEALWLRLYNGIASSGTSNGA